MSEAGDRGDPPGRTDDLFDEYLREQKQGNDFDGFVARHPEQAHALRAMHSLWIAGDLADARASTPAESEAPTEAPGALQGALKAFGDAPSGAVKPVAEDIPGFKLLEVLGEGGFGVVWKAEQEWPIRRTVAIKIVKRGMDSREAVARFEAERQALALMNHASIARVYDAGATASGRPYFVMEFIRGEPITSYCDSRDLSIDDRLQLFLTVCEAVGYAHQKGVIHRDLKPSNVLVSLEGDKPVPKVIDFGIAKAIGQQLTEHTLQTEMGQIIGTPAYMSPEQADTSRIDIDTRSDVYSLGVLFYEMLASVPPFERETFRQKGLEEVLRFVREEEPKRPSTRLERWLAEGASRDEASTKSRRLAVRRLRGDLDWIVLKAMAKERGRRYQAVSELAADIHRHLRHEPVLAGPPSWGYRLRKLARKHRTLVSVALLFAVVAFGTAATFRIRAERDFRDLLGKARAAVPEKNIVEAKKWLTVLLESHFGRREVRDLEVVVAALDLEVRSEASAKLLAAASDSWAEHLRQRDEARKLELEWDSSRRRLLQSAPPWERTEEFDIHKRWQTAERDALDRYDATVEAFQRAIDAAPRGSEAERRARTAFASAYQQMQDRADREGFVVFSPDFFRRQGSALDAALFARHGGTIRIHTIPPGADVYCYRYEEHEKRLLPLPFSPTLGKDDVRNGILRGPALYVEAVLDQGVCPLRPGDRLELVAGKQISVLGDLARALDGLEPDTSVPAQVHRGGRTELLAWLPFPRSFYKARSADDRLVAGKLTSPREQLGVVFAGYPLELVDGCRLGRTQEGGPLEVFVPDGSYLLVLRLEGHAETRFPVRVSREDVLANVRLLPLTAIPVGFLHVPAGPFPRGGDSPPAFQSLPLEVVTLRDYLISRFEVTFADYLEFLNDPQAGVDELGEVVPTQDDAKITLLARTRQDPTRRVKVDLVPAAMSKALVKRVAASGRWAQDPQEVKSALWPVFGVSRFAAEEYAHWLTRTRPHQDIVRYRLPTDDEWEKAARGVDRRFFVWGDYPVWSFSWVNRGIPHRGKKPAEVGFVATDESVYGVRDLTGSVSELVLGKTDPSYTYSSYRGGNWNDTDEYFGRVATRNGRLPLESAPSTGFRLVAELRAE